MSFGVKMPKSVRRCLSLGITELKASLSKGQGHRSVTQGIMTKVGYHRAIPVSGCVCRKLSTFSLWVVCSSLCPSGQVTTGRGQGQARGWDTSYQNAPSVTISASDKRRCEAFMKYEVFTGIQPLVTASGIQWKQDILVDDINTQQKACDGNKGYDFSTPMVLSSPYSWRWFYLFLCFSIYSLLPEIIENDIANNNIEIRAWHCFECLPYVTVFVRCFPSTSSPVITITLGGCLPHFTNEENRLKEDI